MIGQATVGIVGVVFNMRCVSPFSVLQMKCFQMRCVDPGCQTTSINYKVLFGI